MSMTLIGINHENTNVNIRSKWNFNLSETKIILNNLLKESIVSEAFLLSTCNRTELYFCDSNSENIINWLSANGYLDKSLLLPYFYEYNEINLVKHLMKVACGLNSLVVGEVEILGQIKKSYETAISTKSIGKRFDRLLQLVFKTAKSVRFNTNISKSPISIASIAVRLSTKIFNDLENKSILLIGAGDTIKKISYYFNKIGVNNLIIANRSLSNAKKIALKIKVKYILLSDIYKYINLVDIIITATSSNTVIVKKDIIEKHINQIDNKPIYFLDLSVPNDIETSIGKLKNMYLYNLDDLKKLSEDNKNKRKLSSKKALYIIEEHIEEYKNWMSYTKNIQYIIHFKNNFNIMKKNLLEISYKELKQGKNSVEVIDKLANLLTKKFIHESIRILKKLSYNNKDIMK